MGTRFQTGFAAMRRWPMVPNRNSPPRMESWLADSGVTGGSPGRGLEKLSLAGTMDYPGMPGVELSCNPSLR